MRGLRPSSLQGDFLFDLLALNAVEAQPLHRLLPGHRRRETRVLAVVGSLVLLLLTETASATELLEAKVTAGAKLILQNTGGTVRLERARVDATDHPTFYVPEPGALMQLSFGLGGGTLLHARRRRVVARYFSAAGS